MNAVLAPRPLVVLNQTGAEADALVAAAGLPVALADDAAAPAWERAADADVLFTGPRNGWRNAPAQPRRAGRGACSGCMWRRRASISFRRGCCRCRW